MNNIGICFPNSDFDIMPIDNFKVYLLKFKEVGVTSFDFYTAVFLNNSEKLENLVSWLNENNMKITFHYYSPTNINEITSSKDYVVLLNKYQEELLKIRNNLKKLNVNYKTTIVFHALDYLKESRKYNHEHHLIDLFQKLSDYGEKLNFEILIETLSYNHPIGNHIGDDIGEIEDFITNISNANFGICWDIGHTRLNNIENETSLYLPDIIMNKVKFTHIHNVHLSKDNESYMDHLPLTKMTYQKEELNYLMKNNYQGVFSIETSTDNLKENILVYLNSVKILKETLESLKEEIK